MSRIDVKYEIDDINYLKEIFLKFGNMASHCITKLKKVFEENESLVSEITDNSFEFTFWGLDFVIKAEISYDPNNKNFKKGELNTYLKNDEAMDLILSYNFDYMGNIGNGNMLEDFAYYYYVEFVHKLISISNEKNIKFQFK